MSWTFLFQVASASSKTKYNMREEKRFASGASARRGLTGTLGIGFNCLYSWPGTLLTGEPDVLSLLVGTPCLKSMVCEAVISRIYLLL